MNGVESLLMIGGISLNIFATMEFQGSLVAKIQKKCLAAFCFLVCIWQTAAFFCGNLLAVFLLQKGRIAEREQMIGTGIAVLICAGMGVHLLLKAIRTEKLSEHRENHFNIGRISHEMAGTGTYTLLAGIAFGFVESNRPFCLIIIICLSVVAVIAGTYTGYHFGYVQRRKIYGVGTVLFWIVGIDFLLRMM